MGRTDRNRGRFITLKEAAILSGYTSDHLARLARTKYIRGAKIGRSWLVREDDLQNYLTGPKNQPVYERKIHLSKIPSILHKATLIGVALLLITHTPSCLQKV